MWVGKRVRFGHVSHMIRFACLPAVLAACAALVPLPAAAQSLSDAVRVEVLSGWRMDDGTHMAGLRLALAPGWKTYWRAPGDAGIPPLIGFATSVNVGTVTPVWPTPTIFWQNGLRSVGYSERVVIPLHVAPQDAARAVSIGGALQIGICNDVCVPVDLDFAADLPATAQSPDPQIAAALADIPFTAAEASVTSVSCRVEGIDDGLRVMARILMPPAGAREDTVIETGNPMVWVAEPVTGREGGVLTAVTDLVHVEGQPFALDRSALRITVLGSDHAVDIQGCPSP